MDINTDQIYTFKLNSGEEMVTKVMEVTDTHYLVDQPVSIAPGQQGMQMIPSAFTMELKKPVKLNISAVTMVFETNEEVINSYKTATTGVVRPPEKKILTG